MNKNILFVDDDANILAAYKRRMQKYFTVYTATSGQKGLEMLENFGPFAVIIADKNMPQMDGIDMLKKVSNRFPNTVRVMLTGKASLQSAIDAVNEGRIFRFLTKPCSAKTLKTAIEQSIEQYRLVISEKELIEKTLFKSINVLTEILSLVNPTAFSRASRISRYVEGVADELGLEQSWRYRLSAMLSQIGCITIPAELLDKVFADEDLDKTEKETFENHPVLGSKLIADIPRLKPTSEMIAKQLKPYQEFRKENLSDEQKTINIGAQILHVTLEFDKYLMQGKSPVAAVSLLRKNNEGNYNTKVVNALEELPLHKFERVTKKINIDELRNSMIIAEDVKSINGVLLVPKGQLVTNTVLEFLNSFSDRIGIKQPFKVEILQ